MTMLKFRKHEIVAGSESHHFLLIEFIIFMTILKFRKHEIVAGSKHDRSLITSCLLDSSSCSEFL